jgi:hypothetical protein
MLRQSREAGDILNIALPARAWMERTFTSSMARATKHIDRSPQEVKVRPERLTENQDAETTERSATDLLSIRSHQRSFIGIMTLGQQVDKRLEWLPKSTHQAVERPVSLLQFRIQVLQTTTVLKTTVSKHRCLDDSQLITKLRSTLIWNRFEMPCISQNNAEH